MPMCILLHRMIAVVRAKKKAVGTLHVLYWR